MQIHYRPFQSDEQIPLHTPRMNGIGAWLADDLIGRGLLTIWRDVGEISDLWVDEAYRNRGIGTAIIRELAKVAKGRGVQFIEIGVTDDNIAARRLYERLGFVPHRRLDDPPQTITYLRCSIKNLSNA
ncbi:MAG: GNAT family N-acetyltransferase [Anaerolineae bacterium]|jgi:ribosomal protein S18 acetylase RimI-like enzyme|nr:GNAT family N-acetyltransferase [Anaerolineae bacterium]